MNHFSLGEICDAVYYVGQSLISMMGALTYEALLP
jgi:hypothetical protein